MYEKVTFPKFQITAMENVIFTYYQYDTVLYTEGIQSTYKRGHNFTLRKKSIILDFDNIDEKLDFIVNLIILMSKFYVHKCTFSKKTHRCQAFM